MKTIRVGMIGLGTVGMGTAAMLLKNSGFIDKKINAHIILEKILVNDINKDRPGIDDRLKSKLTDNPDDILLNEDIDIVVEVMGGTEKALSYVKKALSLKKHVVTANKDMMASYGNDLFDISEKNGAALLFEASVCAAIPVVDILKRSLAGNKISRILGILNGTTNYILTQMEANGTGYEENLVYAQKKGYAESKPENDVMGHDAANKIAILATMAFNMKVQYDDVYIEGITGISLDDIKYACELGYKIKLIADAKYSNGGVEIRVNPLFMPIDHPLAKVDGVFNAVYIESDMAGETMIYGKGAGSKPTASAVVGDIMAIADAICSGGIVSIGHIYFNDKKIIDPAAVYNKFYLRLRVNDSPGVLSKISGVLGDHDVSIFSVVQKNAYYKAAEIVIVTHRVKEKNMMESLEVFKNLDIVDEVCSVIRVEDEK